MRDRGWRDCGRSSSGEEWFVWGRRGKEEAGAENRPPLVIRLKPVGIDRSGHDSVKAFQRIPRESSRLFAFAMTLPDKEPCTATRTLFMLAGRQWVIFIDVLILRADYDTQRGEPLSTSDQWNETSRLTAEYTAHNVRIRFNSPDDSIRSQLLNFSRKYNILRL